MLDTKAIREKLNEQLVDCQVEMIALRGQRVEVILAMDKVTALAKEGMSQKVAVLKSLSPEDLADPNLALAMEDFAVEQASTLATGELKERLDNFTNDIFATAAEIRAIKSQIAAIEFLDAMYELQGIAIKFKEAHDWAKGVSHGNATTADSWRSWWPEKMTIMLSDNGGMNNKISQIITRTEMVFR